MKRTTRSRPVPLCVIWAVVLIRALAFQFRATEERFPRWFGNPHAGWPFLAFPDDSAPQLIIGALAAGAPQHDDMTLVVMRIVA